ncbi:hypothetical protein [Novosphingobium lindaniclasticum]
MKSTLIAAAAFVVAAIPGAAIANNTSAHLKGHTAVAAPKAKTQAQSRGVCHPEPSKGRDCRHRNVQAQAATAAPALASAEVSAPKAQ